MQRTIDVSGLKGPINTAAFTNRPEPRKQDGMHQAIITPPIPRVAASDKMEFTIIPTTTQHAQDLEALLKDEDLVVWTGNTHHLVAISEVLGQVRNVSPAVYATDLSSDIGAMFAPIDVLNDDPNFQNYSEHEKRSLLVRRQMHLILNTTTAITSKDGTSIDTITGDPHLLRLLGKYLKELGLSSTITYEYPTVATLGGINLAFTPGMFMEFLMGINDPNVLPLIGFAKDHDIRIADPMTSREIASKITDLAEGLRSDYAPDSALAAVAQEFSKIVEGSEAVVREQIAEASRVSIEHIAKTQMTAPALQSVESGQVLELRDIATIEPELKVSPAQLKQIVDEVNDINQHTSANFAAELNQIVGSVMQVEAFIRLEVTHYTDVAYVRVESTIRLTPN